MSDIPLNSLKRHPEFYFDDGSVVLVAQDTSFHVYRALLAAHSTVDVLADMFSSLNNEANSNLEGCPVAYLSDSPQDVGHFLRVLLPNAQPSLSRASTICPERLVPHDFDTWERGGFRKVELKNVHSVGVIGLTILVDKPSLLPWGKITDARVERDKAISIKDRFLQSWKTTL
uniref:LysM domain-containing protein n=1 Tax=Ganoderma boninense TaxID=34458 RepID=A0A5K1JZS0_9APHY|nr:LysM domain-containing protein [Ganoderma boninense]